MLQTSLTFLRILIIFLAFSPMNKDVTHHVHVIVMHTWNDENLATVEIIATLLARTGYS